MQNVIIMQLYYSVFNINLFLSHASISNGAEMVAQLFLLIII